MICFINGSINLHPQRLLLLFLDVCPCFYAKFLSKIHYLNKLHGHNFLNIFLGKIEGAEGGGSEGGSAEGGGAEGHQAGGWSGAESEAPKEYNISINNMVNVGINL